MVGKQLVTLMYRENACAKIDICISFFLFGVVKLILKAYYMSAIIFRCRLYLSVPINRKQLS